MRFYYNLDMYVRVFFLLVGLVGWMSECVGRSVGWFVHSLNFSTVFFYNLVFLRKWSIFFIFRHTYIEREKYYFYYQSNLEAPYSLSSVQFIGNRKSPVTFILLFYSFHVDEYIFIYKREETMYNCWKCTFKRKKTEKNVLKRF